MSEILLTSLGKNAGTTYGPNEEYNVVKNYPWTLTPPEKRPDNIPYIRLVEYEQDVGTLYQSMAYWFNQGVEVAAEMSVRGISAGRNKDNPYSGLYSARPTDTSFVFPYFEEYDHVVSQNWGDASGVIGEQAVVDAIITGVAQIQVLANNAPGVNVMKQKSWKGSTEASYTVNFFLFNTGNPDDIQKNITLKRRLQMSSLHDQKTAMLTSPPALFSVEIPGVRFAPAAVISNFTVSNIGQMNIINKVVVPDAYKISITITELLPESRQTLDACCTNNITKVQVYESAKDIFKPVTDTLKNIKEEATRKTKA